MCSKVCKKSVRRHAILSQMVICYKYYRKNQFNSSIHSIKRLIYIKPSIYSSRLNKQISIIRKKLCFIFSHSSLGKTYRRYI